MYKAKYVLCFLTFLQLYSPLFGEMNILLCGVDCI